ncbi:MAG: MATE family efflux transporter, partial [Clostridia bacterium]|nr:MATE family efflux transporter [Clostridia bacterium]
KTSDEVASLSTYMIIVFALIIPFDAYATGAYFTLRSGGKVIFTVLFDSVFMWVVIVPVMLLLSRLTDIDIRPLFAIGMGLELLKALLGFILLRKTNWAVRLVKDQSGA